MTQCSCTQGTCVLCTVTAHDKSLAKAILRIGKLERALGFYADRDNWTMCNMNYGTFGGYGDTQIDSTDWECKKSVHGTIEKTGGKRAREALKEIKQ